MDSLRDRLEKVMQAGNLTVADLAHWLNRPHATVSLWLKGSTRPGGRYAADLAYSRLLLLEQQVRAGLRVPEISAHKRPEWIRQARIDAERDSRFPTRNTA